ncbi:alpha/beta fold hydrolase, partial [Planctomycetota bacterium]|nr:alpha/beta fold hydrolase [Planctomycetota bacterium]
MIATAGIQAPEIAPTPFDVVLRRGPLTLRRYRAAGKRLPVPVVLVPSIINRPYILDLREGQSLVAHLLSQGLDVYLIDWGLPTQADAGLDLAAYSGRLMRDVLRSACATSGSASAHLFGYCLGGTFSLIAAARGLRKIASVVALTTPVDM